MGILVPIATGKEKRYWAVGVGTSLSLLIEVIQLITSLGYFDPDDIMLNTLGTIIGYGLWKIVHKKTFDRKEREHYNDD